MSSTSQATSSTCNIQLIIDNALAGYAKIAGIDLFNSPFAAALEQSNSPEAILQLLQEREKAFNEYRDDNRRLLDFLSPAVKVLQTFSGIMSQAASPVSHTCNLLSLLNDLVRSPSNQQMHCLLGSMRSLLYDSRICRQKNSPVTYGFSRLPVASRQATMRYWICLNA